MPSARLLVRRLGLALAAASTALASPTPAAAPGAATPSAAALPPTDAWVSVGPDGTARTVTPVLTTVDGTPTVVSAAPTTTAAGSATTTVQPGATATNGAGSFPVCSNVDGDRAPFCAPADGSTLNPGVTYYITWDPRFFAATPNTTLMITGNLFNATTGAITTQAFSSNTLAAGWAFYAWTVDKALLASAGRGGVNVSLSMTYLTSGGGGGTSNNSSSSANGSKHIRGPLVTVAYPEPYRQKHAELPTGAALYIGLPTIVAFVVLMIAGTCLWNRRTRRIGLGNVMGRAAGRSRGYGIGRSRRQRVGALHLDSKDAIRLQTRDARSRTGRDGDSDGGGEGDGDVGYDDFGTSWSTTAVGAAAATARPPRLSGGDWALPQQPRRASNDLGSLAGTPTEERFGSGSGSGNTNGGGKGSGSSGNAFRDELRRQEGLL